MVRPKRDGDWVPITARLDPDAARRLRVAAARRGTTQGRLLDELILAHLPPAEPLPAPAPRPKAASGVLTAEGLRREMARLRLTQTELAKRLLITQKAVSEWFERGRIPAQRVESVEKILAAVRAVKHKN